MFESVLGDPRRTVARAQCSRCVHSLDGTLPECLPKRQQLRGTGENTAFGRVDEAHTPGVLHSPDKEIAVCDEILRGVNFVAEDVAASSELKVRDEAGNITVLSPHNFSRIPGGRSEEMAWSFYSERDGKYMTVDMLRLARLLEKLTGEKLVYTGKVEDQ